MAHFGECRAEYHSFFSIEKSGSKHTFSGRRYDVFEDFGDVKNGSIFWLIDGIIAVTQEVVAAGSAASFGFIEVGGVAVNM